MQKIVGITRTKDIVMRSKRIPGKQALDWGIATECVPDDKLEAATDALVDELLTFSPIAQRTAKKLLNDTEDSTLAIAIELEGHCYSRLRQSNDFKRRRRSLPRQARREIHRKLTGKLKAKCRRQQPPVNNPKGEKP